MLRPSVWLSLFAAPLFAFVVGCGDPPPPPPTSPEDMAKAEEARNEIISKEYGGEAVKAAEKRAKKK